MTNAQRHLFPMPQVVAIAISPTQREVLDWVAYNEGGAARFPDVLSRQSLRKLIGGKLVKIVGHSPGRYRLTEVGRLARTRHNGRSRESLARAAGLDAEE